MNARTKQKYRAALNTLPTSFRRTKMRDVSVKTVRLLAERYRGEGYEPKTIVSYLAPVRAMFASAANEGDLKTNPLAGVADQYSL